MISDLTLQPIEDFQSSVDAEIVGEAFFAAGRLNALCNGMPRIDMGVVDRRTPLERVMDSCGTAWRCLKGVQR